MASLVRKINNTVLDFVRGVPFQALNKFEVSLSLGNELLSSAVTANGGGAIANIAQSIIELTSSSNSGKEPSLDKIVRVGTSIILQLYAQSITIPLPEIETASLVNGVKYIKDLKMPDEFEISFLEDELGLTLRIIDLWRLKIVGYDNYVMYSDRATSKTFEGRKTTKTDGGTNYWDKLNNNTKNLQNFSGSTLDFFGDQGTFDVLGSDSAEATATGSKQGSGSVKFNKGIETYKANMTVKPLSLQDDLGVPPYPSFQMKGVFPKSIDSITFSHDSSDFLIHKVKFSVDTVYTRFI